jgi:hypothetical protein
VLRFGASQDDVCAGCGRRGHVAWISGELALVLRSGESQPHVVALDDLSLSRKPTSTAFLDLYLCGACLEAASALTAKP